MSWVKTVERDHRGRNVNVYTDEDGWKIIQVLRHRGLGGNPRFFYGDEPRVSYRISDGNGRDRIDRASTVKGAKRAVLTRKAIDAGKRDAQNKLSCDPAAYPFIREDEELVRKYTNAWFREVSDEA